MTDQMMTHEQGMDELCALLTRAKELALHITDRAARAALSRPVVPEGWKLVPETMPDWGAAPPGATHYQPHQDAYYKRVSASEWYVWSRMNDREPMRWHPSLGTGDNAEWVVRPAEAQPGWYCAHCQRGVDAREVTYSEQHEVCGRYIANDDPPPPSAPEGGPVADCCEECGEPVSECGCYPKSVKAEQPERLLAKHQPCGCVICDCEDDHRCHGCGAKHCGTHPVHEIPNPVYVEQEQPEGGPAGWRPMTAHRPRYGQRVFLRRNGIVQIGSPTFDGGDDGDFWDFDTFGIDSAEVDWESDEWMPIDDLGDCLDAVKAERDALRERVKELIGIIDDIRHWDISNLLLGIPHPLRKRMQAVLAAMQEGEA